MGILVRRFGSSGMMVVNNGLRGAMKSRVLTGWRDETSQQQFAACAAMRPHGRPTPQLFDARGHQGHARKGPR